MICFWQRRKDRFFFRFVSFLVSLTFSVSLLSPVPLFAQNIPLHLPPPGTLLSLSPSYTPPYLRGLKVNPNDPFKIEFLFDSGDSALAGESLREEAERSIKYFMAALTLPEKDLWVNLSPYEKDRVAPENLSQTDLGRDLLSQDYILKQITASLIYPENDLGKTFWDKIYKKSQELYGTTEIPVNTFNKVWIIPDKAVVYQNETTAFTVESHLKVMLDEDYIALEKNQYSQQSSDNSLQSKANNKLTTARPGDLDQRAGDDRRLMTEVSKVSSPIIREVILPALEEEVNQGKNFAQLRQIYNAVILAAWFKKTLKESLLGQIYVDKSKIAGIDLKDTTAKEAIYQQYLQAFKKGVYDYIKEDYDSTTQKTIPRKYFSGGLKMSLSVTNLNPAGGALQIVEGPAQAPGVSSVITSVGVDMTRASVGDQSMLAELSLTKQRFPTPVYPGFAEVISGLSTSGRIAKDLDDRQLFDLAVQGENKRADQFEIEITNDPTLTELEKGAGEPLRQLKIQQFRQALARGFKTAYGSTIYYSNITNRSAKKTEHYEIDGFKVDIDQKAADPEYAQKVLAAVEEFLKGKELIQVDRSVGQDPKVSSHFRLLVSRDYGRLAHELTALHFPATEGASSQTPDILTIDLPDFDLSKYGLAKTKQPYILRIPSRAINLVLGTDYFGEVKKSALTTDGYLAKLAGNISLHAGSKVVTVRDSKTGQIVNKRVLASGLSGTGKTTTLVGKQGLGEEDEDEGSTMKQDDFVRLIVKRDPTTQKITSVAVKGLEAGIYYKTERLDPKKEPELHGAAQYEDTVLSNVWMDETPNGLVPDYNNVKITANGRGVVKRSRITDDPSVDMDGVDAVIWLTRRETIVPALTKLTPAQASAYWLLGESVITSAADPTRAGQSVREAGFSPFIVGSVAHEANLLLEIFETFPEIQVVLANTGRVGATYGEGATPGVKIDVPDSAAIFKALFRGNLETVKDAEWGYEVASNVPGYDISKLNPAGHYFPDKYNEMTEALRKERRAWLKRFPGLDPKILAAIETPVPNQAMVAEAKRNQQESIIAVHKARVEEQKLHERLLDDAFLEKIRGLLENNTGLFDVTIGGLTMVGNALKRGEIAEEEFEGLVDQIINSPSKRDTLRFVNKLLSLGNAESINPALIKLGDDQAMLAQSTAPVNVAINGGSGRIGLSLLVALLESPYDMEPVALNDLAFELKKGGLKGLKRDFSRLLRLELKKSSVPEVRDAKIDFEEKDGTYWLLLNDKRIRITDEKVLENLKWDEVGTDIVYEATGVFTNREDASRHFAAGAKEVIITGPSEEDVVHIVAGVNQVVSDAEKDICSGASCTTGSIAPVLKVLDEAFGIESYMFTTTHSYTNDQRTLHSLRTGKQQRGFAAAGSIIYTDSGAAVAAGRVLAALAGKGTGFADRVPTINGSTTNLSIVFKKPATVEEINAVLKEAAKTSFEGIMAFEEGDLISEEILRRPESAIVQGTATRAIGNHGLVKSWYDNEWGFSNRVVDLGAMRRLARLKPIQEPNYQRKVPLVIKSFIEGMRAKAHTDQAMLAPADVKTQALNRQDPKRLNGLTLEDGSAIRVLRDLADYPTDPDLISHWDKHYAVFEIKNPTFDYTAYMAIHRLTQITSKSPILNGQWHATGGTRILRYNGGEKEALANALELAQEMSFKNAGVRLAIGGSKCTIYVKINPASDTPKKKNPDQPKRQAILASYAKAVEYIGQQLGGGVLTGQDINISVDDARLLFEHAPTSIVPYVAPDLSKAPTPPTAVGVIAAMKVAVSFAFPDSQSLKGKVVAVQGLGGVGSLLLEPLLKAGAIVIASDVKSDAVESIKKTFESYIAANQLYVFGEEGTQETGYSSYIVNPLAKFPELKVNMGIDHVDIFAPSAAGEVLNDETIPQLKEAGVKVVAGSANNATKDKLKHTNLMRRLDILYVPDYVANAGGVMAVDGHLGHDTSDTSIETRISHHVRAIIERAKREKKTTQEVADEESRNFFESLIRAPLPAEAIKDHGDKAMLADDQIQQVETRIYPALLELAKDSLVRQEMLEKAHIEDPTPVSLLEYYIDHKEEETVITVAITEIIRQGNSFIPSIGDPGGMLTGITPVALEDDPDQIAEAARNVTGVLEVVKRLSGITQDQPSVPAITVSTAPVVTPEPAAPSASAAVVSLAPELLARRAAIYATTGDSNFINNLRVIAERDGWQIFEQTPDSSYYTDDQWSAAMRRGPKPETVSIPDALKSNEGTIFGLDNNGDVFVLTKEEVLAQIAQTTHAVLFYDAKSKRFLFLPRDIVQTQKRPHGSSAPIWVNYRGPVVVEMIDYAGSAPRLTAGFTISTDEDEYIVNMAGGQRESLGERRFGRVLVNAKGQILSEQSRLEYSGPFLVVERSGDQIKISKEGRSDFNMGFNVTAFEMPGYNADKAMLSGPTRIGINGARGAIGSALTIAALEAPYDFEIAALNDPAFSLKESGLKGEGIAGFEAEFLKRLKASQVEQLHDVELRFEEADGKFWLVLSGGLFGDREQRIRLTDETEPEKISWGDVQADLVYEASGRFTLDEETAEGKRAAKRHIIGGAKEVIITTPSTKTIAHHIAGVSEFLEDDNDVCSGGSCTMGSLGAPLKALDEAFGVKSFDFVTVLAYNNELLGYAKHKGKDTADNTIYSPYTLAAIALGFALPQFAKKGTGIIMGAPQVKASVSDISIEFEIDVTAEEINDVLKKAASEELQGIMAVEEDDLSSKDIEGRLESAIIQANATRVPGKKGKHAKVVSWYDNVDGFVRSMIDLGALRRKASLRPRVDGQNFREAPPAVKEQLVDKAMVADARRQKSDNIGGINLDSGLLDLQIKRDGNGVPLPLNMQPPETIHIEGLIPIIINITPVTNLPLLLGVKSLPGDQKTTDKETKDRQDLVFTTEYSRHDEEILVH